MTLDEATDRAVAAILSDIGDRRGIGDELDGIDAETRGAMVDKWRRMVRAAIQAYGDERVREEREACAVIASPLHNVGASENGCPWGCSSCATRRSIRSAIRARGREVKP